VYSTIELHNENIVWESASRGLIFLAAEDVNPAFGKSGNDDKNARILRATRHRPVTERFKMSEANEAFKHLEARKARYRIVLDND
jgi:hypothetical protein